MNKIVIAPDSFKGSLTAQQAAQVMAQATKQALPKAQIITTPLADGGEGTASIITAIMHGSPQHIKVLNPLGHTITATYGLLQNHTAIIDLASASGLSLLKPEQYNIMQASTFGTGQLIAQAIKAQSNNILIALGGSATNDGGMGLLQALGFSFYNHNNTPLPACAQNLMSINRIETPSNYNEITQCHFTILSDVNNPLCGPMGAANTYAPQKGATPKQVEWLDLALRHWNTMLLKYTGINTATIPGSGAAGGTASALLAFMNADLKLGIDFILKLIQFNDIIKDADLIITGEGSIDAQSLNGKLLTGVITAAAAQNIPIAAFAGKTELTPQHHLDIININPPNTPTEKAMIISNAETNLYNATYNYLINKEYERRS